MASVTSLFLTKSFFDDNLVILEILRILYFSLGICGFIENKYLLFSAFTEHKIPLAALFISTGLIPLLSTDNPRKIEEKQD